MMNTMTPPPAPPPAPPHTMEVRVNTGHTVIVAADRIAQPGDVVSLTVDDAKSFLARGVVVPVDTPVVPVRAPGTYRDGARIENAGATVERPAIYRTPSMR